MNVSAGPAMPVTSPAAAPSSDARPLRTVKHVVLADDHDLVRAGIQGLIELLPGVEVIAQAGSGEELLVILERVKADMVVTDIHMPGMDGLQAVAKIRLRHPQTAVLVLSMCDTADVVQQAVASGANGYLMKNAAPKELQNAVETVLTTGCYFNSRVARLLMEKSESCVNDELTDRQEILSLLAWGMSSKEIAFELKLCPKTVDVHRARIMERLNLRDVASLTRYAVRRGLVKA